MGTARRFGTTGGRFARLGVVALALLLAAADSTDPGRIESMSGTVEIGSGEPPRWRAAQPGDMLAPGDQIRTGANGRAELRLTSGAAHLYEHSLLRIPFPQPQQQADFVELEDGASMFDVLHRGRPFEVRTLEAVAMVKGTRFGVSVDAAGAAVSVYRGLVGVRAPGDALDREVLVRPGSTAFGGADAPFQLRMLGEQDPWESFSSGGPRPPVPAELRRGDDTGASRESARAAAYAAIDRFAPPAAPAPDDEQDAGNGGDPRGVPSLPASDPQAADPRLVDGVVANLDQTLIGSLTASTTGSSREALYELTFTDSGGMFGDTVRITGPGGLDRTLTDLQLINVVQGNSNALGPTLLEILNGEGTTAQQFAYSVLNIMHP
jgi:hypothetical protein